MNWQDYQDVLYPLRRIQTAYKCGECGRTWWEEGVERAEIPCTCGHRVEPFLDMDIFVKGTNDTDGKIIKIAKWNEKKSP